MPKVSRHEAEHAREYVGETTDSMWRLIETLPIEGIGIVRPYGGGKSWFALRDGAIEVRPQRSLPRRTIAIEQQGQVAWSESAAVFAAGNFDFVVVGGELAVEFWTDPSDGLYDRYTVRREAAELRLFKVSD